MKKVLISFILFLLFYGPVTTYANTTSTTTSTEKDEINLQGYKELYEAQKDYNDRILATVYWSLGGMVTVIVALFSLITFFNYRINIKELNDKIKDLTGRISEETNSAIDKIVKDKFNDIRNNFEELAINNSRKVEELSEKLNRDLSNALSQIYKLEAEQWKNKGVFANAFMTFVRAAEEEQKANRNIRFTIEAIVEVITQMKSIDATLHSYLNRLLNIIPVELDLYKKQIIKMVEELPIK